jgi:hypothetical protein
MAIRRTSSQTIINRGVTAAAVTPVNIITGIGSGGGGATVNISSIQIANSTFVAKDDTAIETTGGYMIINGTGFQSGAAVYIQGTAATSTAFVSSSRLNVTVPALSSGVLDVYVVNTDGSGSIYLRSLNANGTPSWTTTSPLTTQDSGTAFAINLVASGAAGDGTITYAVSSGSSLPSGTFLSSNGYFYGTVSGIEAETTYSFSVDAIDAQNQETARSFNITVAVGDTYFRETVLLINGETSNNTWITDVSTNKFALTVNGDTRPMAFSPYETVWSNFFDGSGDYLRKSGSGVLIANNDVTIECWIYPFSTTVIGLFDGGPGETSILRNWGNNKIAKVFQESTGATFTVTANVWQHFACTATAGNIKVFINGSLNATGTYTEGYAAGSNFDIGGINATGDGAFNGYISNFRVTNSVLYTTTFTPPTSPLTAIANTSLLTCQSNRLIDNSTNNFALTRNGDVTVSNFGPFTETDVTTGSAYFDGATDSLTVPDNSSYGYGTGDFTIEFWMYPNSVGLQTVVSNLTSASSTNPHLYISSSIRYYTANADRITGASLVTGQWYHIALCRNSGSTRLFVNGTQSGSTYSDTNNYGTSAPFGIATYWTSGSPVTDNTFSGYISNLRILKGTGLYTSAFTPPTSPLTAIANTSLLTLQSRFGETNSRFVDTSGLNHLITRNGDVTQGNFSPFSQTGWSCHFNGSSAVRYTGSPISTSQSNFTIEAWVFPTANPTFGGGVAQVVVDASGEAGGSYWGFGLTESRNVVWRWYDGASGFNTTSVGTVPLNEWSHIAVSVNSNTIRLFINGTLQSVTGTSTLTNRGGNTGFVNIGRYATTDSFFGYISNARLIAGTGLYTSSFTPSTTPLTAITNTSLLSCQSNRLIDNSTNNRVITTYGSPSVQPFGPFKPTIEWSISDVGGSMFFDGTGDYLTVPNNAAFEFGSGNFTIEFWAFPQTNPTETLPVTRTFDGSGYSFAAYFTSGTVNFLYNNLTTVTGTATLSLNTWSHIAYVRNSNTLTIYVNGTSAGSGSISTSITSSARVTSIGAREDGNFPFTGYISNVRLVKGTALYTSNFTPPTTPATPVSGTTLLLNGTNGSIIDSTARNFLRTLGNTQIRNNIKRYDNASLFFDGSGDNLSTGALVSSPQLSFGTGNFTIEGWFYFNDVNSRAALINQGWGDSGYDTQGGFTFDIAGTAGGTVALAVGTMNAGAFWIAGVGSFVTGTWYHIALVRNGTNISIYSNGQSIGSNTLTSASTIVGNMGKLHIGSYSGNSFNFNGYIDDFRITKGIARYTSNFTVPSKHKLK